jgi:hypothetical protein
MLRRAMVTCSANTILLVLALANPNYAQTTKLHDEVLEINGIELRLGMNQDFVFKKFREKKVNAWKLEPSPAFETWVVCEPFDDSQCVPGSGQITFREGRLYMATKNWVETKTASDVATAFYGAAKDLEQRGFTSCKLAAKESLAPGQEIRYVDLHCGERLTARLSLSTDRGFVVDVEELLGP